MTCGPAADCALAVATHPWPGRACRSLTACENEAPRHALSPRSGDPARRASTWPRGFRSVGVTQPPAGPNRRTTRNGPVCRLRRAVHRRPALPRACRGPCRVPYAACVLPGGGWGVGGTISFLCCQSRRRSSAAQSMLWGACGAVYAFEPSLGPVGRQPHAGDTHTRRALREGGTTVDALLQSVWDRGTLLAPATIRRPTLSSPATFARTFFELGLCARAFFLPSSSVFELASWSDRPCRLVSDRAFPVCIFLPTTPLSPLIPPCRGGGRVVVGRRRQIPGAGRRTDSTRGCRSWG